MVCAELTAAHEPAPVEVSVVMPCLNEAQTLPTCITKAMRCFEEHGLRGEVLVVDNGSTDGSPEIAETHGARVVHQPVKGYGIALRTGFEHARGRFIVMGDADDSYDFLETHRFVHRLREGWDLVMGTRLKGEIRPGAMPWHHRYIGNPILTFILNLLYRVGISDAHCGLRGFRRDAYEKMYLRTTGMELASEMVIKASKAGLLITEIPIVLHPDGRDRPPHLRSFRDGWRHLRFMLMLAPQPLFIWPGLALVALGFTLLLTLLLFGNIHLGRVVLAENTMVLGMMMIVVGVQAFYLGLYGNLFTYMESHAKGSRLVERILKFSQLEVGMVVALLLVFVGLGGIGVLVKAWYDTSFGNLSIGSIRWSIVFSTLLVVGIQVAFSSFFLHMIGIERDIYIGDLAKASAGNSASKEPSEEPTLS